MELSPESYGFFVRPKWYTEKFINNTIKMHYRGFDFNNKKVLDFGCGIGSNCSLFDYNGYLGIDCDAKRIQYARKTNPNYRFVVWEKENLPFSNKYFDYIFIMAVLHHIPQKQRLHYVQEFYRILKSNGKIMVIEPCIFHHSTFSNWYMRTFDKGKYICDENQYLELFFKNHYSAKIIKRFKKCYLYNELSFLVYPKN